MLFLFLWCVVVSVGVIGRGGGGVVPRRLIPFLCWLLVGFSPCAKRKRDFPKEKACVRVCVTKAIFGAKVQQQQQRVSAGVIEHVGRWTECTSQEGETRSGVG